MNTSILVPVDFNEPSMNAAEHGAGVARSLKKDIILLHIAEKNADEDTVNGLTKKLEALSSHIKSICSVETKLVIRKGRPVDEIIDFINEENPLLTVMGTPGKKGVQYITGSNALKIITSSVPPVIIVQKRTFEEGYKRILIPVNNFSEIELKSAWAVKVASFFNAQIHLFLIPEQEMSEQVKSDTETFINILKKNNIAYQMAYCDSRYNFSGQVLEYAVKERIDLMIIMTNPEEDQSFFFMSTQDEQFIYNSHQIPVLCINPSRMDYLPMIPVYY